MIKWRKIFVIYETRTLKKKALIDYYDTPEHRRHPSLELKLSIIRRCFEDGEDIKSVSKDSGYSRTCIYLWRRKYVVGDCLH